MEISWSNAREAASDRGAQWRNIVLNVLAVSGKIKSK